jgi:hypothetical protein
MTGPAPEWQPESLVIAGRRYVEVLLPISFAQRLWLSQPLHAAGLLDPAARPAGADAMFWQLVERDQLWPVLAGSVAPEGEAWTEDRARALIPALKALEDESAQAALVRIAARLIAGLLPAAAESPPAADRATA